MPSAGLFSERRLSSRFLIPYEFLYIEPGIRDIHSPDIKKKWVAFYNPSFAPHFVSSHMKNLLRISCQLIGDYYLAHCGHIGSELGMEYLFHHKVGVGHSSCAMSKIHRSHLRLSLSFLSFHDRSQSHTLISVTLCHASDIKDCLLVAYIRVGPC